MGHGRNSRCSLWRINRVYFRLQMFQLIRSYSNHRQHRNYRISMNVVNSKETTASSSHNTNWLLFICKTYTNDDITFLLEFSSIWFGGVEQRYGNNNKQTTAHYQQKQKTKHCIAVALAFAFIHIINQSSDFGVWQRNTSMFNFKTIRLREFEREGNEWIIIIIIFEYFDSNTHKL